MSTYIEKKNAEILECVCSEERAESTANKGCFYSFITKLGAIKRFPLSRHGQHLYTYSITE